MKRETYCEPSPESELHLDYCGTEICGSDFCMRPHIRREYLIHYILAGSGHFHTPQRDYDLESGDIFLIYPNQPVSYETDPLNPLHFSWFSFSGTKAADLPSILGFSPDSCVQHLHSRFSINGRILECIDLLDSGKVYNPFLLQARLYDILGLIYESRTADDVTSVGRRNIAQEHVHRATSYIRMNYMNPISVRDVVDFVGLERSYFSKIFHKYTGKTSQEYLLSVRIEQSKMLLEQTSYSAKEISSFVGFSDECYFSRIFRKMTGVSPKTYRHSIIFRQEDPSSCGAPNEERR